MALEMIKSLIYWHFPSEHYSCEYSAAMFVSFNRQYI